MDLTFFVTFRVTGDNLIFYIMILSYSSMTVAQIIVLLKNALSYNL